MLDRANNHLLSFFHKNEITDIVVFRINCTEHGELVSMLSHARWKTPLVLIN